MSKQLKTMSVNSLLEEISVCESMATLVRIKKFLKQELESADEDTVRIVDRLLSYKMRVMTNKPLKNWFEIPEDQYSKIITEHKMNFYDCIDHFFKTNDIYEILGVLHDLKSSHQKTQTNIENAKQALRGISFKYQIHKIDIEALEQKLTKNKI